MIYDQIKKLKDYREALQTRTPLNGHKLADWEYDELLELLIEDAIERFYEERT
jgi:hypothetical protein